MQQEAVDVLNGTMVRTHLVPKPMRQARRTCHYVLLCVVVLWSLCQANLDFVLHSIEIADPTSLRLRVASSRPLPSTRRMAVDADNSGARQKYTWAEAHDVVKGVEAQLTRVTADCRRRVNELDELFTDGVIPLGGPIPGRPPLPVGPDVGGERIFPDVEKYPPVLAGDVATGKPMTGAFSSLPEFELPDRVSASEFMAGVADDEEASAEENDLWRDATNLRLEQLADYSLWEQAEEELAALVNAERRAEDRRLTTIGDLRERVLKQMDYANEQLVPMADLDKQLTVLQTDKRLLKYLGLLEQSALEAEGLQEALEVGSKLNQEVEGRQKEKLQEELSQSFARTRRLDIRIRACCSAAQDLPGQMDGMKELGDMFNSMNPFR